MCSLKVATCAHESRLWVLQQCRDGLNLDAVLPYHLRHTMSMRTVLSANKRAQVKEERMFCSPSKSTEIQSLTRSAPCASERRDQRDNGMKGSVLQTEEIKGRMLCALDKQAPWRVTCISGRILMNPASCSFPHTEKHRNHYLECLLFVTSHHVLPR